jgi:hypothetical protein
VRAKDVVLLNQLVYKNNPADSMAKYAPEFEIVFYPDAVDGNSGNDCKKERQQSICISYSWIGN